MIARIRRAIQYRRGRYCSFLADPSHYERPRARTSIAHISDRDGRDRWLGAEIVRD